jgi:poly(A) polymerase
MSRIDARWLADPGLSALASALGPSGGTLHVVGGAVRDALTERARPGDFDAACDLGPEEGRAALDAAGIAHDPHPFRDDVSFVDLPGRVVRDVSLTFRGSLSPGSDAARRDFTCNAVYLGLDGSVLDPLGGADDIGRRLLRPASPDAFSDDPVRILRYPRMLRLLGAGAVASPDLAPAAAAAAAGLAGSPPIRVMAELCKLLDLTSPEEAIADVRALDGCGALRTIFPEADLASFAAYCRGCAASGLEEGEEALPRIAVLGRRADGSHDERVARFDDLRDARVAAYSAILRGEVPSMRDAAGDALVAHAAAFGVGGGRGDGGRT